MLTASRYPPREYFVLTDAGKPVFTRYYHSHPLAPISIATEHCNVLLHSRPGSEDSDNVISTIGIMQALISVFLDDDDKLRCINAGNTRITFLIRSPLYYVCASSWGEPESVVSKFRPCGYFNVTQPVDICEARQGLI